MRTLILVRGLPGSGKTTFANAIAPIVLSADDYFTDKDGNYNFDPSKLKIAHKMCQDRAEVYMQNPGVVAVANTFTREWEMKPYFELAEKYGFTVHTVIVENRHGSENIHNVPEHAITSMKDRFEVVLG